MSNLAQWFSQALRLQMRKKEREKKKSHLSPSCLFYPLFTLHRAIFPPTRKLFIVLLEIYSVSLNAGVCVGSVEFLVVPTVLLNENEF